MADLEIAVKYNSRPAKVALISDSATNLMRT